MAMAKSLMKALDVGTVRGPEIWRVVDGVEFSHWDRWLLRLSIAEPDGLDSIEATFRERLKVRSSSGDAEAMLAQVSDLKHRLSQLGRVAGQVLDDEECASEWLFKKAWKRVWHDGPNRKTRAMIETPRWRLERRALRGHWPEFVVSPSRFEAALTGVVGPAHAYLDYRIVGSVAETLHSQVLLLAVAASKQEALALYRCAMTTVIETMNRADDSDAELAVVFDAFETAYLDLVIDFLDEPFVLVDLIELAIWEDYGLVRHVEPFFTTLPERHADAAMRCLARIVAELRRETLGYQLERATRLRAALLVSLHALPNATNDDPP